MHEGRGPRSTKIIITKKKRRKKKHVRKSLFAALAASRLPNKRLSQKDTHIRTSVQNANG